MDILSENIEWGDWITQMNSNEQIHDNEITNWVSDRPLKKILWGGLSYTHIINDNSVNIMVFTKQF